VRLRAAKLAREFPLVLQMLERNELHLSAIKLLAPHLTQANCVQVLGRARCRSKRQVEMLPADDYTCSHQRQRRGAGRVRHGPGHLQRPVRCAEQ
jgi:hypothetical protein